MSKLLEQINYPADLRKLKKEQLTQVTNELREELINVVSETGGHLGAGLGVVAGVLATHGSGDPLLISAAALTGLVIGYQIGDTFDKVDQMYATMLLSQSLDGNNNFQSSTWKHPQKNIAVNAMPVSSEGECREFVTSVQVNKELNQMRGTACRINNEWQLKEIY